MAAEERLQKVSSNGETLTDPNFDRKLDAITAGAPTHSSKYNMNFLYIFIKVRAGILLLIVFIRGAR
jgi:hypothetical protein